MEKSKRKPTTIYLNPAIARAVKVQAAMTESTVSDFVNDAIADRLRRYEENIRVARERRKEKTRPFEDVLRDLKRDGLI